MQLTNVLLSLLLSITVVATKDGNKTAKAVTDKSLCKEMASLNKLVSLASNETRLASKTKNDAEKIAEIQAKASAAATTLATMSTNQTLVTTCAAISAAKATKDDCEDIRDMQKLIALAANATKLNEKAKGDAEKIASFQAKAATAQTKLAELMGNATLAAACETITAEKDASRNRTQAAAAASEATGSATLGIASDAGILEAKAVVLSTIVLVAGGMILL